jgi:hypothetical protein
MHFGKLSRGELIAIIGGIILGIGVFLAWYSLGNKFAHIDNFRGTGKKVSAWDGLQMLRYILLAAAVAPIILAYIVIRDHALSWPRGELTAVVGITALTLIVVRGLIIKPGSPSGEISLTYGWWVALLGAAIVCVGSVLRASKQSGPRKPPGVL